MAIITTLTQLKEFAATLALGLEPGAIIGLSGELGAGKTTLVNMVGQVMGVSVPMTSPTYVIAKEYKTPKGLLVHIDAYRLDSLADGESSGIMEYILNPNTIVFIEWPEKILSLLPIKTRRYQILVDANSRRIEEL